MLWHYIIITLYIALHLCVVEMARIEEYTTRVH